MNDEIDEVTVNALLVDGTDLPTALASADDGEPSRLNPWALLAGITVGLVFYLLIRAG
jgi:hypothetical protein